MADRGQDWWLWVNHIRHWNRGRRPGVYADIAANDPIHFSNTFLLDHCLGWSGVCVEPSPTHHRSLQLHRRCQLETHCVTDQERDVTFLSDSRPLEGLGAGLMDRIVPRDDPVALQGLLRARYRSKIRGVVKMKPLYTQRRMRCLNVTTMLQTRNITHVDVLSLDVEGPARPPSYP